MLRLVALILLALLLALGVKLWAGDWGLREIARLQGQIAMQKAENAKLKQRNDALAADVEDLRNGKDAIEERARTELGLIKPDEIFYQVVDPDPAVKKNDGH
ncbi:MAG TPA: cell division protein FtsB [Rudaea sp.]|uniref:cell division protein FtsB n=1 Tax=Rudaea sp. TaxID=2136325 RepID=UPI002F943CDD